jgi:hypothetical protein
VKHTLSIRRIGFALTLALAASACVAATSERAAASDDPLQAPECRDAIATLQAQETAADAAARAGEESAAPVAHAAGPALLAARRDAARRCLASRADPPVLPGRLIRAPIVVAPMAVARPVAPAVGHAHPVAPLPLPTPGPRTVTSCDAAGCWANDGTRLNRIGPNLLGKRGVCTLTGTLLQCP